MENLSHSLTPWEYALQTATGKVLDIYTSTSQTDDEVDLLIGADTIISIDGTIIEKPRDEAHQMEILKRLNGRTHTAITAVVCLRPNDEMPVSPGYILKSTVVSTEVSMEMNEDMMLHYISTKEGLDKAGGYAIQGLGAVMVKEIRGSYDNVVGLPLFETYKLIQEVLDYDVYAEEVDF